MTRHAHPSLRCAIYARVSSDKQDVENSFDRQLRACREWSERNGHYLLDTPQFVDEAKSGDSMVARPALQRLLTALREPGRPPFDAILVDDDSRLDRGGNLAQLAALFRSVGVTLISVDDGRDLTSDNARLLNHVKAGMNEQYLHELARRTRDGIASKVLKGYHGGGKVYGYRLVPEWPEGLPPEKRDRQNRLGTRIEIDEAQAPLVRRIFEESARGVGRRRTALALNAEHIPSARGGSWDPSAVRAMLLNSKYRGDWSWNRSKWSKKPELAMSEAELAEARIKGKVPRRRKLRPAEDLVPYLDEDLRIVSEDVWTAVQAQFFRDDGAPKRGRDARRTRSPIAGLIACSCGGNLTTHRNTAKGHTYVRLGCAWNKNRGPDACGNDVKMRMELVAEPLLAFVREELLDPASVAEAVEQVNRKIETLATAAAPAGKVEALQAEVTQIEGEIAHLVEALARGTAYEAISAALTAKDRRMKEARTQLAVLSAPIPSSVAKLSAKDVIARLGRLWTEIKKLDGDRTRLALRQIFDGIVVKPLRGAWANGWTLEMRTRPWAVLLPRDASELRLRMVAGAGFEPATFGL